MSTMMSSPLSLPLFHHRQKRLLRLSCIRFTVLAANGRRRRRQQSDACLSNAGQMRETERETEQETEQETEREAGQETEQEAVRGTEAEAERMRETMQNTAVD